MSAQSCQERTNDDGSERTKQRTGSSELDGDNQGNDGLFPKVKGSGPVKRAREEYEERRRKMARKRRTGAASDGTENVQVEDLLPPSYRLFVSTPDAEGARLRFVAKCQDDGEVVYVLPTITNRGLVEEVLCEFEEKGGNHKGLYMHGLQGVGKSHSLLYLVHHLRGQPDKYRVTYVHDCRLWVNEGHDAWRYILEEILFTFALDTFPPDSRVHECCAKMLRASGCEDPSRDKMVETFFDGLVSALERWVRSKNLLWVTVFDQVNVLENFEKKEEWSLPATCSWVRQAACTVSPGTSATVVATSATNETIGYDYKSLRPIYVGLDQSRFSDEETRYMVRERFPGKLSLDDIKDDVKHLSYRTGNTPGNVVSVLRTPGDNLRNMVDTWEHGPGGEGGYAKAVRTAHREYREYLAQREPTLPRASKYSHLDELQRYVVFAALHIPVTDMLNDRYVDHRYMYTRVEWWSPTKEEFCYFCDPVAHDAIVEELEEPVNMFGKVAKPVIARLKLSSIKKGAILEDYILQRLRIDQKVKFTIHQCKWVHTEKKKEAEKNSETETVKIDFAQVMSIPRHSYLPKGDIQGGWIYYIPDNKTYKGCDLVIVNKSIQCAYAIQITTSIESHEWTWWDNDNENGESTAEIPHTSPFDRWREYLGFDPQLVWLCPRLPRVDSPSNRWCNSVNNKGCGSNDHYFILLKDLEEEFEALAAYEKKVF